MPDFIAKNLKALAIAFALVALAGYLFFLWADQRGFNRCESGHSSAALTATQAAADANQAALGREAALAANRAIQHTTIRRDIEDHHAPDDDLPAPALDQLFYDRLRAGTGGR